MKILEIGSVDVNGAESWLRLLGEGRNPLINSCKYLSTLTEDEAIEEEFELFLRGGLSELSDVLAYFRQLVQMGKSGLPGRPQCFLRSFAAEDGQPYRSPVLKLEMITEPGNVELIELGRLKLSLRLERKNYFESQESELSLLDGQGNLTKGGVLLWNHSDADPGHCNTTELDLGLSQEPQTLRFEIFNSFEGEPLGDFELGMLDSAASSPLPELYSQAEAGGTGAFVFRASASGGFSLDLGWSGNAWTKLLSFRIAAAERKAFGSAGFLPYLRFGSVPADSSLRLRLRILCGSVCLYQGPVLGVSPGKNWLRFGQISLAEENLPAYLPPQACTLELEAIAEGTDAHVLEIDTLSLIPLKNYAGFIARVGLPGGGRLVDDPAHLSCWSKTSEAEFISHERIGTEFIAQPGKHNLIIIRMHSLSSVDQIERNLWLRVWGRKRRQLI